MVAIDGIYAADENGAPQFQVLLAPSTEDIHRLAAALSERIPAMLRRRELGPDREAEECDPLSRDQPGLAAFCAASVAGRSTLVSQSGRRLQRIGDQIDLEMIGALASPRCASVDGFSLHANTAIHAADRARLERLFQYCARPPIAVDRLELLPDGRLRYRLKRPWNDGTTHVLFDPLEFLEKVATLVPAPRAHLIRYAGILAPAAKWRPLVVPQAAPPSLAVATEQPEDLPTDAATAAPAAAAHVLRNYSWAELMKRVWLIDVLECPRCRGRMRLLASIHSPTAIQRILQSLGLPSRPPPVAGRRPS